MYVPTSACQASHHQCQTAEYVVIITGRELRGRVAGHDIYRATDFDVLPLNPNITIQHPPHPVEGHLLALLRSHLSGGFFLFSYGWDLTRRLQAQWDNRVEDEKKAFWQVVSISLTSLHGMISSPFTSHRRTTDSSGISRWPTLFNALLLISSLRFLQTRLIECNVKQNVSNSHQKSHHLT